MKYQYAVAGVLKRDPKSLKIRLLTKEQLDLFLKNIEAELSSHDKLIGLPAQSQRNLAKRQLDSCMQIDTKAAIFYIQPLN